LMGDIHVTLGDSSQGEASLLRAIQVAQSQQAKMLELRAAISLARLQCDTGRQVDAHALLRPLYDWFQEGHDTPELREARALLEPPAR
jgi:predicted ATPase